MKRRRLEIDDKAAARVGTTVLNFFLRISKDEQGERSSPVSTIP